jgi:2-polyprenyl-6-methoxyphenol hydroxylase-like FAD-dependent oxidoreductase
MTATPDAPRPALGELARLATADAAELNSAAQEYEDSADACDTPALAGFRRRRYARAKALRAAADRVLQLVALATGGATAEDAIDDALEQDYGDLCSDLAAAQEALVLLANQLERHSVPFVPERELLARGMEAATAVIRAALTPERPADAD